MILDSQQRWYPQLANLKPEVFDNKATGTGVQNLGGDAKKKAAEVANEESEKSEKATQIARDETEKESGELDVARHTWGERDKDDDVSSLSRNTKRRNSVVIHDQRIEAFFSILCSILKNVF